MSNFTTIPPVASTLIHADRETDGRANGRADVTKLTGTFHD